MTLPCCRSMSGDRTSAYFTSSRTTLKQPYLSEGIEGKNMQISKTVIFYGCQVIYPRAYAFKCEVSSNYTTHVCGAQYNTII